MTGKSSQKTASSISPVATGTIRTVADLFAAVKQKDSSFQPKSASKVVNPDGTPMVVYHGTSDPFTEFKHSELSDREGSFFFAQNREDAEAYTGNGTVMEVYVNLQYPIDYNNMPSEIYKIRAKKAQVAALRKLGYDGWLADMDTGWGEISAFNSNQIKSATDNIGTFDGSNPDIRYKVSARTAENDFDYSQLNWARDAGIITGKDVAIFERTINNEIYRGGKPQTANGEYIIDTGRCLMFTDGDFHNPTLSRVIVFATEYESLTADAKEMIRDDAATTGDIQESIAFIKESFGVWFISEHSPPVFQTNGWKNRGGKGAAGTGSNPGYRAKSLRERLAEEGLSHLLDDDASDNKLSIGASRKMLVDAFEGMIQSPDERKLVDAYRSYLSAAEDIEAPLREVRSQIQQKVKEKAPRRSLLTVLIVILKTLRVVEWDEESPS